MKLHLWGTDFRRSTPELRQKLFIAPEDRAARLAALVQLGFPDLVYLCTCNRIEFYTTGRDYFSDTRPLWLAALKTFGLDEEDFYRGYQLEGKSAVRHLLRVASSLESLVVGEPQILGQLKEALRLTKESGLPLDRTLERLFTFTFETAKRVRTQTAIGEKPVSVATLGLMHLQTTEKTQPLTRAVVVGRSPISLLTIQWLRKNRPACPIVWVNRRPDALAAIPESAGTTPLALAEFIERPFDFSHLFTATASSEPIFREAFFRKLGGERKMVIDFAQPPDVERSAEVERIATLLHLEDLNEEARSNAQARSAAVAEAEAMLEVALREHCLTQKEAPLLRDFSGVEPQFLDALTHALESLQSDLPDEALPKIRRWAEKLVKKNLHSSREHLRTVLRNVSEPTAL